MVQCIKNIVIYLIYLHSVKYKYLLVFFWIYLVEHSIKIFGLGLVPFLSEFWNIYDLINVNNTLIIVNYIWTIYL